MFKIKTKQHNFYKNIIYKKKYKLHFLLIIKLVLPNSILLHFNDTICNGVEYEIGGKPFSF